MNWLHNFLITKFHTESFTFHFYRGLNVEIRSLIDDGVLAIGGYILTRSPEDINDMAVLTSTGTVILPYRLESLMPSIYFPPNRNKPTI